MYLVVTLIKNGEGDGDRERNGNDEALQ